MKVRSRLTWAGMAITLATCAVVCFVVYEGMRRSMLRQVDRLLAAEMRELVAKVQADPSAPERAAVEIEQELGHRPVLDVGFRLLDPVGHVIISCGAGEDIPAGDVERGSGEGFATQGTNGALRFRRLVEAISVLGEPRTAIVLYDLTAVDRSLEEVRLLSGLALLIAGGLSWVGAGWMARRSLRPVASMTTTAREIGESGVTERLHRTHNGDELDELAETLNDMLDRVERHVRSHAQFTADASHELRTPLAALRGMAEVALIRSSSEADLREVVSTSLEHYERLSRLADGLLLLAQGDSAAAHLDRRPLQLAEIGRQAVDLYGPLVEDRGGTISLSVNADSMVDADRSRLQQLVANLIDNAVKYSAGPPRIEITINAADRSATITVRDHGPGIPDDEQSVIFERFYRSDQSRATGGAGLGLSICRWIANAHGGGIAVASRAGEGASFVVTLPRRMTETSP